MDKLTLRRPLLLRDLRLRSALAELQNCSELVMLPAYRRQLFSAGKKDVGQGADGTTKHAPVDIGWETCGWVLDRGLSPSWTRLQRQMMIDCPIKFQLERRPDRAVDGATSRGTECETLTSNHPRLILPCIELNW